MSADVSKLPREATGFIFLHVSSCFPRSIDVLLVPVQALYHRDDVTLLIKTFPDHCFVQQLLADAGQGSPLPQRCGH